jgi:hypothetical protein
MKGAEKTDSIADIISDPTNMPGIRWRIDKDLKDFV